MRAGSKGVRNKNIKIINGKPLMYYTIKQAKESKIFDKIIVSTYSKKIFKKAKSYGVDGWFLRPKKLASNESSKVAAIKHAFIEAEKYYKKQLLELLESYKNILIINHLNKKWILTNEQLESVKDLIINFINDFFIKNYGVKKLCNKDL